MAAPRVFDCTRAAPVVSCASVRRGDSLVWKLFLILALLLLPASCEKPRETGAGGSTPGKAARNTESTDRQERSSRRKLDRDLRGRYSDKTVRRRYNLSKRQLDTVKKELRKKDPSLATKASQNPPVTQTPAPGN